jgi:hypothetical protein
MPKVRDIVLDQLRGAGNSGAKAAAVRQYIETTYSTKIHEKTVGMTLYRLSQDNAVHRKGQIWFFGPPPANGLAAESENPGAGTPGPTPEAVS